MAKEVAKSVLLVESDPEYARFIEAMFRLPSALPFQLTKAESLATARHELKSGLMDVVLLDIALPGVEQMDAVTLVHQLVPGVAIVLLTAPEFEVKAALAMQQGAQDYLVKGQIEPRELMRALRNAIERKVLEEALFEEKERAQVTLDSIGDAVICTDEKGNISFLNPVAESMTGCSLKEAVGQPLAETLQIIDADTGEIAANPMENVIGHNRPGRLPANCILTRADGHQVYIEDSIAPISDRFGAARGSVLVFRDVTRARALAAQVAHLAEHDFLTGLPNRLLLRDRLNQAIAQSKRHESMIAILFLDLDGFKHINDSLGHTVGDKLLQSVANRLQGCVRNPDTVSRQGGDEFLIVLQDLKRAEDAGILARRVLDSVAAIHMVDNHELLITTSIGISIFPDDGLTAETLIQNADTAMYQTKEHGRHGFRYFKPAMNVIAVERQAVEEGLRHAIERKELVLHYQPIVDLGTGAICGAEALLRWNHPTRGVVCPMTFIPIAEATGLILPIGAWVMHEACAEFQRWETAGLAPGSISVNVSAIQFQSEDFLDGLLALLQETGFDPKKLELELTETVLMRHADEAASTLQQLRSRGIRISLDDFGTGYSSLNYLRKFPLDSLKIDQSFVRQIANSDEDANLIKAILSMARSLNLSAIAEGVETAAELGFLKENGCELAQGYLFSKPVSAEQFTQLLIDGLA